MTRRVKQEGSWRRGIHAGGYSEESFKWAGRMYINDASSGKYLTSAGGPAASLYNIVSGRYRKGLLMQY